MSSVAVVDFSVVDFVAGEDRDVVGAADVLSVLVGALDRVRTDDAVDGPLDPTTPEPDDVDDVDDVGGGAGDDGVDTMEPPGVRPVELT